MVENKLLKGILYVGLGASSYGMLATFVKLAYSDTGITGTPYTPAEIIASQFTIGIVVLLLINLYRKTTRKEAPIKISKRHIFQLMLAGTSTGMTSIFYYLAVKYIPVSIGIVLLMQTVWMGVLVEMILLKKRPSSGKLFAVFLVLGGTLMATNLLNSQAAPDWRGIVLGLMAATSFTTTMFAANRIAVAVPVTARSLFMLLGGAVIVTIFVLATQHTPFNYDIFYKWGIVLALFGTILPPMLMNSGFPLTGIGIGSIVAAIELPVSVLMAFVLLNEKVIWVQWLGIVIILVAIVIINIPAKVRR